MGVLFDDDLLAAKHLTHCRVSGRLRQTVAVRPQAVGLDGRALRRRPPAPIAIGTILYTPRQMKLRGLYEALLTKALAEALAQLPPGFEAASEPLRAADAADRLALHVARAVERTLDDIPDNDRVTLERNSSGECYRRWRVDTRMSDCPPTFLKALGPCYVPCPPNFQTAELNLSRIHSFHCSIPLS